MGVEVVSGRVAVPAAAMTTGPSTLDGFQRGVGEEGGGREGGDIADGKQASVVAPPPRPSSSSPVMSLSGHLIGPGVRLGGGGDEVKKWALEAFMKEAVTWDNFSRYPQVRCVCLCSAFSC